MTAPLHQAPDADEQGCTCGHAYRNVLIDPYGGMKAEEWVRTETHKDCPTHGWEAQARQRAESDAGVKRLKRRRTRVVARHVRSKHAADCEAFTTPLGKCTCARADLLRVLADEHRDRPRGACVGREMFWLSGDFQKEARCELPHGHTGGHRGDGETWMDRPKPSPLSEAEMQKHLERIFGRKP